MNIIIIDSTIDYDYPNTAYKSFDKNVLFYMLNENVLLCNPKNKNHVKVIKSLLEELNIDTIICSNIMSKNFKEYDINVLLPINYENGRAYLDILESNHIPTLLDPNIELKLSKSFMLLYLLRPSVTEFVYHNVNNFNVLEQYHVFIQLLFPTTKPSQIVPIMKNFSVTQDDLDICKNQAEFIKDTHKARLAMFVHWGLKYDKIIEINNIDNYKKTIGAHNNHNQARFTRYIQFEIETKSDFFVLLIKFIQELVQDTNINQKTRAIWNSNLPKKYQMLIV